MQCKDCQNAGEITDAHPAAIRLNPQKCGMRGMKSQNAEDDLLSHPRFPARRRTLPPPLAPAVRARDERGKYSLLQSVNFPNEIIYTLYPYKTIILNNKSADRAVWTIRPRSGSRAGLDRLGWTGRDHHTSTGLDRRVFKRRDE